MQTISIETEVGILDGEGNIKRTMVQFDLTNEKILRLWVMS
jgi:hypothetical protein